ncbi:MAG: pilin [Patescibacteria group bacterium]
MKFIKLRIKKLIPLGISLMPALAIAATIGLPTQVTSDTTGIGKIFKDLGGVFNAIIPLLMVAATVFFLWGVLQFVTSGGDEDKRKEGRDHIIYGLIGLFIMVAVWGLVGAIQGTFNLTGTSSNIELPQGTF